MFRIYYALDVGNYESGYIRELTSGLELIEEPAIETTSGDDQDDDDEETSVGLLVNPLAGFTLPIAIIPILAARRRRN